MIQSFDSMNKKLVASGRRRVAVAAAHDEDVLLSINEAATLGIVDPILIGHRKKIIEAGDRCEVQADKYEIIEEPDDIEACNLAVRLIRQGRADAIMKGLVGTAYAQSDPESRNGNKRWRALHMVSFYSEDQSSHDRYRCRMCIAPDVAAKTHH